MTSRECKKIFIGVGHGGSDPGAVCGNIVEKQVNLLVAVALEAELKRHGFQVRLSRYGDEADRLAEEIAECNAYQPDFAIEIHTNAGGGSGFEVYHPVTNNWDRYKESIRMAQLMQKQVQRYQKVKPRGVKANKSFAWLMQVEAPAVLCENFFVDGPNAAVYAQQDELKQLAKAYAVAILEYYNMRYIEDGYSYNVQIVDRNGDRTQQKLEGTLVEGHIHASLRNIVSLVGYGVYYNEKNRAITIFPEDVYEESDIAMMKQLEALPEVEDRTEDNIEDMEDSKNKADYPTYEIQAFDFAV